MKKIVLALFLFTILVGLNNLTFAATATNKISYQQTVVKPAIVKYRNGNYVGALQDLEDILRKEPTNTYAIYYLALCHTRLGHKEKAQKLYTEIIDNSANSALVYYSQKAVDCLENPDGNACNPTQASQTSDDMTRFIQSGEKVHPAAMDKIINNRMQRELESSERLKNSKSDASMPTNEEIAQALNTLSKAGLNPYGVNALSNLTNNTLLNPYNNNQAYLYSMLQNSNPETSKMLLYSQMMGNNGLLNIGI